MFVDKIVRTCAAVREELKSLSSRVQQVRREPPVSIKTSAYGWVLVSAADKKIPLSLITVTRTKVYTPAQSHAYYVY